MSDAHTLDRAAAGENGSRVTSTQAARHRKPRPTQADRLRQIIAYTEESAAAMSFDSEAARMAYLYGMLRGGIELEAIASEARGRRRAAPEPADPPPEATPTHGRTESTGREMPPEPAVNSTKEPEPTPTPADEVPKPAPHPHTRPPKLAGSRPGRGRHRTHPPARPRRWVARVVVMMWLAVCLLLATGSAPDTWDRHEGLQMEGADPGHDQDHFEIGQGSAATFDALTDTVNW